MIVENGRNSRNRRFLGFFNANTHRPKIYYSIVNAFILWNKKCKFVAYTDVLLNILFLIRIFEKKEKYSGKYSKKLYLKPKFTSKN